MKNPQTSNTRRRLIQTAVASLCGLGALCAVQAQQAWPSAKPIRIVVGFAPGGTTDVMARTLAASLGEALGQTVLVDNKPGASGNVAATEVIRAQPDGYTFLVAPTSFETANPFLFKQTISPAKDLTPVVGVGRSQMYVAVNHDSPFKDARELVSFAQKNPAKLSYSSSGPGTPPHLAAELFKQSAKFFAVHIPYRGAAPALQGVMGKQADFVMDPGISFPHVKAGKVRMLAVAGSSRSSFFPEVPTLSELGMKGAELDIWFGLWAPNGTPPELTARMGSEIAKALKLPAVKNRYEALGAETIGLNPAEFRKLLADETQQLSTVIRDSKISLD